MTTENLISVAVVAVPLFIAGIVWLVRLEGRINAVEAKASARIDTLEVAAKGHEDTKIEVVRLQEQIKHLTDLLERYFIRSPRARKTELS